MVQQLTCATCGAPITGGGGDHIDFPDFFFTDPRPAVNTRYWNTILDTLTTNTPLIRGDFRREEVIINNISGVTIYIASTPIIAVGLQGYIIQPGDKHHECRYKGDIFAIALVNSTPVSIIEYYLDVPVV